MMTGFGQSLPEVVVRPPGPRSRELAAELLRFECRNVTYVADDFPVFWEAASGANVRDVDGNVYIDLTAAFAVAAAGHSHPEIVAAVTKQAGLLMHGMGDVHPPAIKVDLLRRLAEVAPGDLNRTILANSGAEAIEAALKTAMLATGRSRVLAFEGSYHGLTLGALAVSGRDDFRRPFAAQISPMAEFAPYPRANGAGDPAGEALDNVRRMLDAASESGSPIGSIIVEPVQGRGGDIVPPADWLPGLRRICDERGLLLIVDEIYTGFGRTGRWFACDHWGVVPDILLVGKALTGGMPFAACIGRESVMAAWPRSSGEALHTSTFLGHPLGCAAALASIDLIQREGLVERSAHGGAYALERLRRAVGGERGVVDVRGLGMMFGVEFVHDGDDSVPDAGRVGRIVTAAMRRGVLVLGGGVHGNVLSMAPPLSITQDQLDFGLATIEELIREEPPAAG
jgi:4-aminobutyrate aminotransferase-like enzyme